MRGIWLLIFLLLYAVIDFPKASANAPQIVYCIGNHDATGACWKEGSEEEQKLGCLITSWPIVECQSIPKNEEKQELYECLALQNTGIVNQISLSCQTQAKNAAGEETMATKPVIPKSTPRLEPESTPDAPDYTTVLEGKEITPNAFQPEVDNTTFDVEKPQDFKDAF